jgi:autotransporter-associated beta strand protein
MFTRIEKSLGSFGRTLKNRPGNRRGVVRRQRQRRLLLEMLEDRRLLDATPPIILDTTPSFATSGTLDAGTARLEVEFSEPVVGGDAAGNYQLQSLGLDGLLGTVDDVIVPLSVSYAGTTATLTFAPLPESIYRLTVRDTITDLDGNALDGDRDGNPGGEDQRHFVATPPTGGIFVSGATHPTGYSPYSVTVGDFNGDGKPDLAVANEGSHNVAVLLGNGAGGFAAPTTFTSGGSSPYSVTVGDFNGDGKPDLAVANLGSNNVAVLLGNGAGGFAAPTTFASGGSQPMSVTVGDFNGDGKPDLAVANFGSHNVAVLLGNGAGGFAAPTTFASGGSQPMSVTVGDFNGDGKPDLAVANFGSHNVAVLLGNGAGGFAAPTTFASGGDYPSSVTVGDFNGDGKPDLAVANAGSHNVAVLLGNGAGGFAAPTTFASGGYSPSSVTVGDFNGDGKPDLTVANYNSNNVAVLLGNGAGGFAAPTTFASGGSQPMSVTVGDFNGDGKPDLAVANEGSHNVAVLLGNERPSVADFDSPGGFRFGVQRRGFGAGQLVEGSGNAFDGLARLEVAGQTYAPTAIDDFPIDGGRTLLTQALVIAQLYVSRKITVPAAGSQDFARTVEVLANPTDAAITTTVRIVGNLGSDGKTTVFATSSGDTVVETGDWWIGTDDDVDGGGTPAIVHLIHGPAGVQPTMVGLAGDLEDNIAWEYEITVPARETVRLAHFTILADTQAAAEAAAGVLVTPGGFGGQAAAFLNQDELDSLLNFQFELGSLSAELDDDDNLTITDIDATGKDNLLSIHNDGSGNIVINDANESFAGTGGILGATLSNENKTLTVPLASITGTKIIINGAGGVDTLTADPSNPLGKTLEFHGGEPTGGLGDTLVILANAATVYTPSATNPGDGTIVHDGSSIHFTGLEPVDFQFLVSAPFTLDLAGGDEIVNIANGTLTDGSTPALTITGSSGGVAFEAPNVYNASLVTIDTTAVAGTDTITINSADNEHLNQSLTILTGSEVGDVIQFDGPVAFSGSVSLSATNVNSTAAGTIQTGTSLTITNTGTASTLAGAISGGGGVTKQGSGTLAVSGPNTYAGGTMVSGGVLRLGAAGGLPASRRVTVNATLDLNGYGPTIGGLDGSGTVTSGTAGALTLTVGGNNQGGIFSGVIEDGSGTVALTKMGSGTQQLTGTAANTFTGATTVNAGILALGKTAGVNAVGSSLITIGDNNGTSDRLRLDADEQIPDGATVVLNATTAGTAARFDLNGFSETIAGLSSVVSPVAKVTNGQNATTSTLTVGSGGATSSFGGAIDNGNGTVALTKIGGGTFTLAGANTYTGATTADGGTLVVDGSTGAGGAVNVNSGGTLGGTGKRRGNGNRQRRRRHQPRRWRDHDRHADRGRLELQRRPVSGRLLGRHLRHHRHCGRYRSEHRHRRFLCHQQRDRHGQRRDGVHADRQHARQQCDRRSAAESGRPRGVRRRSTARPPCSLMPAATATT